MVSTRKKRQSNKKLLGQLDDFDQDIIIGNTASEKHQNTRVNGGTVNLDFTVGTSGNNLMTNEITVKVKTLKRCFNERIVKEMSNIIDMVEDRIQNAILTAVDSIIDPKIELAIRSINASSGQDATLVTANSERGEHIGITVPFENAAEINDVVHISNVNDETRNKIQDEVSELLVPETRSNRQPLTHHSHVNCLQWQFRNDVQNFSEHWKMTVAQTDIQPPVI